MFHSEIKELVLTPSESRHRKGNAVAHLDNVLCLFEEKYPQPKLGVAIKCMITGVFHPLFPDSVYRDHSKASFLFVREVQEDDVLVSHSGFERAGNLSQNVAYTEVQSAHAKDNLRSLSPGRTEIYVADNMTPQNRKGFKEPVLKGYAYVKRDRLERTNGLIRIEGLVDINQLEYKMRPNVVQLEREFALQEMLK